MFSLPKQAGTDSRTTDKANFGIELEFANLKDRPARANLLASPKTQCQCEKARSEKGRDQGDVVDQAHAIGAVAGFVEEGAGGGDEHEQQEQAVLGDRPGRCQGRRGQPAWGRFNVGVKKTKILQTALMNQNARNFLELTVCRGKPTIGQRLSINCDRENGVTRRSPSIRAGTRGVPSRPEERTPWGKGCRSATPRELLGFPRTGCATRGPDCPGNDAGPQWHREWKPGAVGPG